MELKEKVNVKELVKEIWKIKQFGIDLLANSIKQNKESGKFEGRVIIRTVDFCLQRILELQVKK